MTGPVLGNAHGDTAPQTARESIRQGVLIALGGNLVDVELDQESVDFAIDRALLKYRQRSSGNATEEAYTFLTLHTDKNEYILPSETIEVRKVFRRRIGTGGTNDDNYQGGIEYDPFDLAFTNLYLLQASTMGGLLTWNLYNEYLNTASVMFGGNYNFTWNTVTKKLQIVRAPRGPEEILMWVYMYRPEEQMFIDPYAGMWLLDCSIAYAKIILGEAREKFQSLAGPQGGVSLNGTQLKAEGAAELVVLEEQLRTFADGGTPTSFVIG
jgi:hypothetical protein